MPMTADYMAPSNMIVHEQVYGLPDDAVVSQDYDPSGLVIVLDDQNPFTPSASAVGAAQVQMGEIALSLFDLGEIQAAEGDVRKAMVQAFGDELKKVGFVGIKADLLTDLLPNVEQVMAQYYAQPLDVKMRDWHGNNGQTGYNPNGNEGAAGAKVADNKELYFVPPNFERWPDSLPEFETVMKDYHARMTTYAAGLMGLIAEYLDTPTEDTVQSVSSAHNLLRLAHYPAARPGDDPSRPWAGAHYDLNALTLLPRTKVPGLQLMTREGEWKQVFVPEGYMIVNTGEALERFSAGIFKAVLHQVLNPGGEWARSARDSTIFFASWSGDFSLKAPDHLVEIATAGMSAEEKEAFIKEKVLDATVMQNLLSRLIEMGTFKNPSEELVLELLNVGLLRQPPQAIRDQYPDLFPAAV